MYKEKVRFVKPWAKGIVVSTGNELLAYELCNRLETSGCKTTVKSPKLGRKTVYKVQVEGDWQKIESVINQDDSIEYVSDRNS